MTSAEERVRRTAARSAVRNVAHSLRSDLGVGFSVGGRCGLPPGNCRGSSVAARMKMWESTGHAIRSSFQPDRLNDCRHVRHRANSRDGPSANSGPKGTVTRFAITY